MIDFSTLKGLTIPEGNVTQIADASGRVLWSAITLIEFTIAGTTYYAEEGMTWGEWVSTSYNTGGFYIQANTLCADVSGRNNVVKLNGTRQSDNTEIVNGAVYTLGSNSPTPV